MSFDETAHAGKTSAIPHTANRKVAPTYDKDLYKARHLIENFFAKLKPFGAIATRYNKTAQSLPRRHPSVIMVWLD